MWGPPGLNVEPNVEPLRSPRSGVVAHRPPGPLVHLSKISGPVRPFSCLLAYFRAFPPPVGLLWWVLGALGGFVWLVWAFSGALKPTVRVYCGAGAAEVLSGRCPGGE